MIEKISLREAVGKFATGVCLVAVQPEDSAPFAMTINSFSSLSLEPPLILWSIQQSSDCYEAMLAAKKFSINILSSEQKALAGQYATKGDHELKNEHYIVGSDGSPIIHEAMVSLQCETYEIYSGGDHEIIVGKVTQIHSNENQVDALMFYKGEFLSSTSAL